MRPCTTRPATSDKTPERHLLPVSRLSATVVAGRDHSCPNKNLQCRDRGLVAGGEEYEVRYFADKHGKGREAARGRSYETQGLIPARDRRRSDHLAWKKDPRA